MKTKFSNKQFVDNIDDALDLLLVSTHKDDTMTTILNGDDNKISRAILGAIINDKNEDVAKSMLKIIIDTMYSLAKNDSKYKNYVLDMMQRTLDEERDNSLDDLN